MTRLKQTKDYVKMDEISWMKVGRKYVYVEIDWAGETQKFKITRKQMEEFVSTYNLQYNKFYCAFEHAYSYSK